MLYARLTTRKVDISTYFPIQIAQINGLSVKGMWHDSPLTAPKVKVLQQGCQAAHHSRRIVFIRCAVLPFPGRHHIVALLQLH